MFLISLMHRFGRLMIAIAVASTVLLLQTPKAHAADPSLTGNASCDGWSIQASDFQVGGLLLNFVTIKVDGVAVHSGESIGTGGSWSGGYSQALDIHRLEAVVIKTGGDVLATLSRTVERCRDSIFVTPAATCDGFSISVGGWPSSWGTVPLRVEIQQGEQASVLMDGVLVAPWTTSHGTWSVAADSYVVTAFLGHGTIVTPRVARHSAGDCAEVGATSTTTTSSAPTTTTTTVVAAPGVTTTVPSATGDAASGTTTTTTLAGEVEVGATTSTTIAAESEAGADDGQTDDAEPDSETAPDDESVVVAGAPVAPQPTGTNPIVLVLAAIGLLAIGGGGTALFFMNRGR